MIQNKGSSKWKDRKEALEGLLEVCKTPRIADANYGELASALAKVFKFMCVDTNFIVYAREYPKCFYINMRINHLYISLFSS